MATRIDQAPNGRKTVLCDITGLGFTRMGNVLDQYTVTRVPWDLGPEPIGLTGHITRLTPEFLAKAGVTPDILTRMLNV